MSPIEIKPIDYRWRTLLVVSLVMPALYLYQGYLPLFGWIFGGIAVVLLVYTALRGVSPEPCIILDDQGVFDKRLKVGVISWDDIRHIMLYNVAGSKYVSLELHNPETYEARRPRWLRIVSQVPRIYGMSPISISTSGLEMNNKKLASLILEGCEIASQRRLRQQS